MRANKIKLTIILLIFFLAGFLSRGMFASQEFTHVDAVMYALGTVDFSLSEGRPAPPGYFLYIMSARLLNLITGNPHLSLSWLSIFYSGLIAAALYYFGSLIKDQRLGITAALLFLTSPAFWYKGIAIFAYLNTGFFILLTALFGYQLVVQKQRKGKVIFWFSISLGILLGVRPQELTMILPLYIFVLCHLKFKEAVVSLGTFLVTCLLWFMPLLYISGGLVEYLAALKTGSAYLIGDIIFTGNLVSKLNNHLIRLGRNIQWAYFLGIIPLVYYIGRFFELPRLITEKKVQFFAVWIGPAIIYNIFIQFGELGHGMNWGLGLLLIIAEGIIVLSADIQKTLSGFCKKNVSLSLTYTFVLVPIILFNLLMFFYDFDKDKPDFYSFPKFRQFNYQDIAKKNQFLTAKVNFIKDNFPLENTLIISSSTFGYQLMYRLPSAHVVFTSALNNQKDRFGFSLFHGLQETIYQDSQEFMIPKGITTLILFDDIFVAYLKNQKPAAELAIGDGYKLLVRPVRPGQKVVLDYQYIAVE